MDSRVEKMRLISDMNHFAAGYRQPIENFANIFFSGAKNFITPELIHYFKSTKCTDIVTMDSNAWRDALSSREIGYDSTSIRELWTIKLWSNGDHLQEMIERYAKDPKHKDHTLYQAMQALIIDYKKDLNFFNYMDAILIDPSEKDEGMKFFESAHANMATMSELESKFKLIKKYFRVSSTDFDHATKSMIQIQKDIMQKTPELSSLIKEYLEDKSEELLLLIAKGDDCSEFYTNIDVELRLLRHDMQDSLQCQKTIEFLVGEVSEKNAGNDEYRELAAIQKVSQVAKNPIEINVGAWLDRKIIPSYKKNMQTLLKSKYMETISLNALEKCLDIPYGETIETYEIFPKVKLMNLLEKGQTQNPNATIGEIISSYVMQHPKLITTKENEVELMAIARIYKVKPQSIREWFERYLNDSIQDESEMTPYLAIIGPEKKSDALFNATKNLTIVEKQLTALFRGSPQFNNHVIAYIDNQKQNILKMAKNLDEVGLEKHAKTSNIITAISGILVQSPEINQRLKFKDNLRDPVLLAEKLRKLETDSPKKAQEINAALTEVLTQTPDMTFSQLVAEMKSNKCKSNPIGKLETAMGSHRNIFTAIMHYFFPECRLFYTETIGIFKNKIIEGRYEDDDMGLSADDFSP
ncbi:MAG: hypothetical protein P1U74_04535 [Legionellaceae bacterium]|nr:hypothetical protein [Legionellaceae bacterium]